MNTTIFERGCSFCRMLSVWGSDAPPPLKCQHCGAPPHQSTKRLAEHERPMELGMSMGVATATAHQQFYSSLRVADAWSAMIVIEAQRNMAR